MQAEPLRIIKDLNEKKNLWIGNDKITVKKNT